SERAECQRRITLQVAKDTPDRFHLCRKLSTAAPIARSHPIAGMFMSIFECQLGDSRLIELAQTFRDHALVLFFSRAREWKLETELTRQLERDATVFRGVRRGKETTVVAVLHVFAVGLEHARVCAGLRKHFAQHC